MLRARLVVVCLLLTLSAAAEPVSQECAPLAAPQFLPGSNMFSPQQEVWLGDAQAAGIEQTITIMEDKALTAYLQAIVDRLSRPLPPDHIPFRVKIIDVPTAEAFSIAGGHIYLSRKIIAFTRSQDELAGVLAHEMGHIIAHHAALTTSQEFRQVLGITQVGDRDDVFAKWNQFVSNYRRQKTNYEKGYEIEEREQLQADGVALYLVTRAGYSPQAFETFFDRLAETKGNTGGFWSNLFGTTKPDSKRLAKIIKNTPAMPEGCVASNTESAANFDSWKKSVIESSVIDVGQEESLPGLLSKRVLTERLRPEIQDIRISPDGKYVLAQDDSNAFILERKPLKAVSHFEARDAGPGQFTPDSRGVVLLLNDAKASPRVERWDIATQKRIEVHEVYVRDGCLLSRVAPDGKTLACLTREVDDSTGVLKLNLDLYDVAAGTSFYHKKGWVDIDLMNAFWAGGLPELMELLAAGPELLEGLSPMAFSDDGHYLVAGSRRNFLAMDLFSRQPIEVPDSIKSLAGYSFAFLGKDRFIGVAGKSGEKSGVVQFPGGQVIYKDLAIGGSRLNAVAHGDHVLLRPIKDHPVGIFDLKQNKIVVASKRGAIDVWDDQYIAERLDGDLIVFDVATTKPLEHAQLPDAPLGTVQAYALSPDLNWLAISQKTRGAVWNLRTGQRMYHVRGFSAACFAPDEGLYLDFPKYLSIDRTLARASLEKPEINAARTFNPKRHTIQVGHYLLAIIPGKENNFSTNVDLELWDAVDEKAIWTKHFQQERPAYHVDAPANSLIFYWQANNPSVKTMAKENPEAASMLSLARNKDRDSTLFVQILDLDTGKLRAQLVIDTGKQSFKVLRGVATNDRLVIADDQDRVLVYSLDGQLKGTVAGHTPQISASADLMTVKTGSGVLELYDLKSMQKRNQYAFGSRVAFNGFSGDGKRMLALTSDQVVYEFDSAATDSSKAVAAK